jgi:hypothetical protein
MLDESTAWCAFCVRHFSQRAPPCFRMPTVSSGLFFPHTADSISFTRFDLDFDDLDLVLFFIFILRFSIV